MHPLNEQEYVWAKVSRLYQKYSHSDQKNSYMYDIFLVPFHYVSFVRDIFSSSLLERFSFFIFMIAQDISFLSFQFDSIRLSYL